MAWPLVGWEKEEFIVINGMPQPETTNSSKLPWGGQCEKKNQNKTRRTRHNLNSQKGNGPVGKVRHMKHMKIWC